jgi:probable HAF family extracellular repeat protein
MTLPFRFGALAGVALALLATAVPAEPQYHPVDLGRSVGTKLNFPGEVSGNVRGRPALWYDGAWHDLHGSDKTVVNDLANNRVAVGTRGLDRAGQSTPTAVMWKPDGRQVDLAPDAELSFGTFIRSDGTAFGMMKPEGGGHSTPFRWQAGRLKALPYVPGWAWTKPHGANDAHPRQIAATAQSVAEDGQCPSEPVLFTEDAWLRLGSLGGDCGGANAVNDDGTVVGFTSVDRGHASHAFVWKNGVMTDLGSLGGSRAAANDISKGGTIVGYATDARLDPHPVAWREGAITALDAVLDRAPDGTMLEALAINEAGQILVLGIASDGHAHTWRLDPL